MHTSRTPVSRALVAIALLSAVGCASTPPTQPVTPSATDPVLAGPLPAPILDYPPSPSVEPAKPAPVAGAPAAAVVRPPAARPATSSYSGPDPCKRALRGDSPVARACSEGGIKTAKTTMKDMVKQGKTAGVVFECDDCHRDLTDHSKLAPDAPEKFQRLLAVVRR